MNYNIENLPSVKGKYLFTEILKKYTWLNIGGPADVLFLPENIEDLQNFLKQKDKNIPFFILGGGSNLLIRDGGIDGVVIKLSNKNFSQIRVEEDKIYCGAGLQNVMLKKILPEYKIGGLEFLCSIPGTIGGALRGNAGCFGSDISQVLLSAKVMNENGDIFEFSNNDFHFGYRHSEFPANYIILEACFKTVLKNPEEIRQQIEKNDTYRKEHQPQKIRTAGSTFKNPSGMRAWELIKKTGSDKLNINGAHMSVQHCNFLDNDSNTSAKNIEDLCQQIIDNVQREYNISLELEIKVVGRK